FITATTTGRRWRTAVSSSARLIAKPPSPTTASAGRWGAAAAAPIAWPRARPTEPKLTEKMKSRGARTPSQRQASELNTPRSPALRGPAVQAGPEGGHAIGLGRQPEVELRGVAAAGPDRVRLALEEAARGQRGGQQGARPLGQIHQDVAGARPDGAPARQHQG